MEDDEDIAARVALLFRSYADKLSADGRTHVDHYIDVGELEMAFESFVLTLMEERISPEAEDRVEMRAIGVALKLDKETVFRPDFWEAAQSYFDWLA
ncbi:hypothetical protein [Roseateles sp. L2-2]|uniref:hypothetical protein n=1 Tax=Roseateles sp. L2-2 TaxID=3422597 RepID=UPI003D36ED47